MAGEAFKKTVQELVIQTDDATPVTIFSVPVGEEKVVRVDVIAEAHSLDMSVGAAADFVAMFARRTGTNLLRVAQRADLIVTTFGAPQPALSLNANTDTQSIDVVLTGKTATVIRWHLEITVRETA